jgi:hypothetical protein
MTTRLTRLLKPLKRTVRQQYGAHGDHQLPGPEVGVVVCTFEKANTLICRIIEEVRANQPPNPPLSALFHPDSGSVYLPRVRLCW